MASKPTRGRPSKHTSLDSPATVSPNNPGLINFINKMQMQTVCYSVLQDHESVPRISALDGEHNEYQNYGTMQTVTISCDKYIVVQVIPDACKVVQVMSVTCNLNVKVKRSRSCVHNPIRYPRIISQNIMVNFLD